MLVLADMSNDQNICWPAFETLARRANIERRQVIRIVGSLENKGLIKIERRRDGDLNLSNIYHLRAVVSPKTPPSVVQDTTGSVSGVTRGSVVEIGRAHV